MRTAWPVATRVQYIVASEEACRRHPHLSARRFCAVAEIPYSTFARWWARWQREANRALSDRPRRPRRCPSALQGSMPDVIRRAHRQLGWGECAACMPYLRRAGLIRCSLHTPAVCSTTPAHQARVSHISCSTTPGVNAHDSPLEPWISTRTDRCPRGAARECGYKSKAGSRR